MTNQAIYTYLCTVQSPEFASFYREHLNSKGIYVKLIIDGEDETENSILFFVEDKLVPESTNILKTLRTQENLSFDHEKDDMVCPDTPYLDTLSEEARWHRNRIFMFKPNGPYPIPGSPYTDWKDQDAKKKTVSLSVLFLWFGLPILAFILSFLIYR